MEFFVPADIPAKKIKTYKDHYERITKKSGNLFLYAGDQKIEHLNTDFIGEGISAEAADPRHLFTIANIAEIGAFATQVGLIARYGKGYPNVNYIAKLNSKTNIISATSRDPLSEQLWAISDVVTLKKNSGLNICGVGYTLYLGSEYESLMLQEAAQMIFNAHQEGLITILWIYPRGKHVGDYSSEMLSGAAGVANALGADFVKLALPRHADYENLSCAVKAAGNTQIIVSGGSKVTEEIFLQDLKDQMNYGTAGSAVGRNLFQRSFNDALEFSKKIAAIIYK